MKKETREKVYQTIQLEEELYTALTKKPEDSELKARVAKFKKDKEDFLKQTGGVSSELSEKDLVELNKRISKASQAISRAANGRRELLDFIHSNARKVMTMEQYTNISEDKGQMSALADVYAIDKVNDLVKFNRRMNGKSFLNVVICKFKRTKSQQQEKETQSPTNE